MTATSRHRKKKIEKLVNDGNVVVTAQADLCEVALNYFNQLFKANSTVYEPVLSLISPKITYADNTSLAAPISKEELREALFEMHPIRHRVRMVSIPPFTNIFGIIVERMFTWQPKIG
jgi:hypothetical protein